MDASRAVAHGNQRELHTRLSEPNAIARMHANSFRHSLSIHERAEGAVIDEHHFARHTHEGAVAP
jgi:hypothetical protein